PRLVERLDADEERQAPRFARGVEVGVAPQELIGDEGVPVLEVAGPPQLLQERHALEEERVVLAVELVVLEADDLAPAHRDDLTAQVIEAAGRVGAALGGEAAVAAAEVAAAGRLGVAHEAADPAGEVVARDRIVLDVLRAESLDDDVA